MVRKTAEKNVTESSTSSPWGAAPHRSGETDVDDHSSDGAKANGHSNWGRPPHPGENRLYDQIYQEIDGFITDGKSANPFLPQLYAQYHAVRAHGPGERWDEPYEYLGLTHLISVGVVLRNSKNRDNRLRAPQFSKWVSSEMDGPFPFEKNDAFRLLHDLWSQPGWGPFNQLSRRVAEIPNAYYFALVNALESGYGTQESLGKAAPGVYHFYRRSTLMPDLYLVGLLAVIVHGDAIRTFEVHRLPGHLGHSLNNELAKAPASSRYTKVGWLKKSRQILIHAFDCVTHAFQLCVISNVLQSPEEIMAKKKPTKENSKFQLMSGMAIGVDGQLGFYSVPAVYVRIGDFNIFHSGNTVAEINNLNLVDQVLESLSTNPSLSAAYNALGIFQGIELPDFVRMQLEVAHWHHLQQNWYSKAPR